MTDTCFRCGHSSDVHSHDDVRDNRLATDPSCPFRCRDCVCEDFVPRGFIWDREVMIEVLQYHLMDESGFCDCGFVSDSTMSWVEHIGKMYEHQMKEKRRDAVEVEAHSEQQDDPRRA